MAIEEEKSLVTASHQSERQPKKKEKKISEEIVHMISEIASQTAIKLYREEKERGKECARDRRYNNAKLLLRSYRSLKEYNEHTIYDIAQLGAEKGNPELLEAIGLLGESRQVESIRDRVAFTRVAMENIDVALEVYKRWCDKSTKAEVQRRWRVLYKMYLSDTPTTPQDVADSENISLSQVYEDINNAAKDMEKRFFGLDASMFE